MPVAVHRQVVAGVGLRNLHVERPAPRDLLPGEQRDGEALVLPAHVGGRRRAGQPADEGPEPRETVLAVPLPVGAHDPAQPRGGRRRAAPAPGREHLGDQRALPKDVAQAQAHDGARASGGGGRLGDGRVGRGVARQGQRAPRGGGGAECLHVDPRGARPGGRGGALAAARRQQVAGAAEVDPPGGAGALVVQRGGLADGRGGRQALAAADGAPLARARVHDRAGRRRVHAALGVEDGERLPAAGRPVLVVVPPPQGVLAGGDEVAQADETPRALQERPRRVLLRLGVHAREPAPRGAAGGGGVVPAHGGGGGHGLDAGEAEVHPARGAVPARVLLGPLAEVGGRRGLLDAVHRLPSPLVVDLPASLAHVLVEAEPVEGLGPVAPVEGHHLRGGAVAEGRLGRRPHGPPRAHLPRGVRHGESQPLQRVAVGHALHQRDALPGAQRQRLERAGLPAADGRGQRLAALEAVRRLFCFGGRWRTWDATRIKQAYTRAYCYRTWIETMEPRA